MATSGLALLPLLEARTEAGAARTFWNSSPEHADLKGQEKVDIALAAREQAALDQSWGLLADLFHSKFGCVLVATPAPSEASSPVYRTTLPGGTELTVWKADLTRHAADAVVNAANGQLQHHGGLAAALARAGGAEVTEESEAWVRKYGLVPTGGFAVTGPGRLGCRVLLHAVGPVWSPATPDLCAQQLRRVVGRVLDYADRPARGLRSLALPAISSGIFGFPPDRCAWEIVDVVDAFFAGGRRGGGGLREVHLVSNEDTTVDALRKAAEARLGPGRPGRAREAFRTEEQSPRRAPAGQGGQRGGGVAGPRLELTGPGVEVREAAAWLRRLLAGLGGEGHDGHVVLEDPLLLCLGAAEHAALGRLQASAGVLMTEHVGRGGARLVVTAAGGAGEGLVTAALGIERLLGDARREWIREKEDQLWKLAGFQPRAPAGDRKFLEAVEASKQEFRDRKKHFKKAGLQVLKVERVENEVLEAAFQQRKTLVSGQKGAWAHTKRLYQPVPWFTRNLVPRIGFQRLLTGPPEPRLGDGIYFVQDPAQLAAGGPWGPPSGADVLAHVFEADVLTGGSGPGQETLMTAPAGCHSVTDGAGTFVVFCPTQALPRYLLTCARARPGP
ncbi:LOW QUALITY PROTEIN: protein mono-ADP-ribosyltransferase PARP9 [Tachyglossus aculeatus]|uniref:LOW QUALITY PROTEIN: protein mono-ADP-ribosyltransferase PARP9 n=1 Tax=Tachyglossus aculeatus TaxID=9261 RepID=UPI0018F34C64|nr:LOW QUALITY PROTEIN: protein mono-ADP-ribosyltransferase PARP9 [Tachyglossus aculeatus]